MSKVKKQHYVPQAYLERFTHDGDHLFVYDKFESVVRPANKKDVAEENYFYDLPEEALPAGEENQEPDRQVVDKEFRKIEGIFNQILGRVISRAAHKGGGIFRRVLMMLPFRRKVLSRRHREDLSLLIALQFMRTREYRETIIEGMRKGRSAVYEILRRSNFPGAKEIPPPPLEFSKLEAATLHSEFLGNQNYVEGLTQILNSRHYWLIGVNNTSRPLYTSDHPVVRRGHVPNQFLGSSGLASYGVEIAFPISPKFIIILRERTYFTQARRMDRRAVELNAANVSYYNSLQVANCFRQVYSNVEDFADAKEFCRRNPEACRRNRSRISVR